MEVQVEKIYIFVLQSFFEYLPTALHVDGVEDLDFVEDGLEFGEYLLELVCGFPFFLGVHDASVETV